MPMGKVLPETLLMRGRDGHFYDTPVSSVVIHPSPPEGCAIRTDMGLMAIEAKGRNGGKRWLGTEKAIIGSDLRIHFVPISERDEVIAKWEDSDENLSS